MELPDKSGRSPQQAVPQKKVAAPVVTGVIPVKRPASRRFFDFVFAESPKALLAKVGKDVVVPRIRDGLRQTAVAFIDGMFYGNAAPPSNLLSQVGMRGGVVNYQAISGGLSGLQQARMANQSHVGGNYQDLVLPSQEAAEVVLANLFELLNQYRVIAIGDLNDLVGKTSTPSDNSYGWTSLDGARISKVRDGFLLELPRPSII